MAAKPIWLVLGMLSLCLSAFACDDGGGDDEPPPPASTTTSASPTISLTPEGMTGSPHIDRTIEIIEADDLAAFALLLRTRPVPCTNVTGAGGPPKCFNATGTPPEDTPIDVFPYGTCELEWQFDADAFAARILPRLGEFFAVVQINEFTPPDYYPESALGIIYTDAEGAETSHALIVTPTGIFAADSRCGGLAPSYLEDGPPYNAPEVVFEGPAFEIE